MQIIKSYATRLDADIARIELDGAGIPSVVVGVGLGMEGGAEGVQLMVPDELVKAAMKILGDA